MIYSNKDIVHLLKSVAASLTLTGANRFRVIAYQKAADAVEQASQEIYETWKLGRLSNIEGIGPSLTQHLDEYFTKPENSHLQKQLNKIPSTVYELMKAPGIGPKKAYRIVKEFNLTKIKPLVEDIRKLASKNKIADLEGFGEKSQRDILEALDIYEKRKNQEDRMSLPIALTLA